MPFKNVGGEGDAASLWLLLCRAPYPCFSLWTLCEDIGALTSDFNFFDYITLLELFGEKTRCWDLEEIYSLAPWLLNLFVRL
jgi:hypothetical protein